MGNKVLIISHNSLSNNLNNGKTLFSLFSHRNSSEVIQLYFQNETPIVKKFDKFFRVRDFDIVSWLFFLSARCGSVVTPDLVKSFNNHSPIHGYKPPGRLIGYIKKFVFLKYLMREALYYIFIKFSSDALCWIIKEKPSSIFLMGSNSPFLYRVGLFFANRLNIPLHLYLTDDYLFGTRSNSFVSSFHHKYLRSAIEDAMLFASSVSLIGYHMVEVYNNKYPRDYFILRNSIDLKSVPKIKPYNYTILKNVRVVYAGGLTLGREKMLLRFCELLSRIHLKINIEIIFDIYSNDKSESLKNFRKHGLCVNFLGTVPSKDLPHIFSQANFLLHVESDSLEFMTQTKLSISTKLPEYMSSGICCIAFGPDNLSSIKIFSENNIGVVLNSFSSDSDNENILFSLISGVISSDELASNAAFYVFHNFRSDLTKKLIDKLIF